MKNLRFSKVLGPGLMQNLRFFKGFGTRIDEQPKVFKGFGTRIDENLKCFIVLAPIPLSRGYRSGFHLETSETFQKCPGRARDKFDQC